MKDDTFTPMHFLRFDLRGHGETLRLNPKTQKAGHINGGFQRVFMDISEIIKEFLVKNLNVEKLVLFGHSMGGLIALEFARTQHEPLLTTLIISGNELTQKPLN